MESFRIAGQLHILAFCEIVITPTEGANVGRPFTLKTRQAFDANGDTGALYLPGANGESIGVGPGETKPKWSIDLEMAESRDVIKHLAPPQGAGFKFVHFDITFTHAPPGRAKITDKMLGCILGEDPTTGKAGDNTTGKIGGGATSWRPGGVDPFDYQSALGA